MADGIVQAESLASLEQVLNEQTGQGIGSALSSLYSAFAELARSPEPAAREGLVAAAQRLIDTLHSADSQMRDIQTSAQRAIDFEIAEINRLSAEIAELNRRIVEQDGIAPANELYDQREQLVREAILKLPLRCREMVRLLFFTFPPKPYKEVAEQLGLAVGSIGFIRRRCLTRLQRALERLGLR